MHLVKLQNQLSGFGYLSAILICFIHVVPRQYILLAIGMSVPAIISVLFIQVIFTDMKTSIKDIAITLLGIGYITGFILYMPLLHGAPFGKYLIWYILFAAWGTDTCAYFIGNKYGKHKLTKLSPHKSVEGLIGGLARWCADFFDIHTNYK